MVIKVKEHDWRNIFLRDISEKLNESKVEYGKYKQTGKVVYLQQAGNKLFSVVENWLMVKYNTRVFSYKELRDIVRENTHDRRLLSKVAQLHYFYYENRMRGEPSEFEDIYLEIYEKMRGRIKARK